MNAPKSKEIGIVREIPAPIDAKPNVVVLSNVFTRDLDELRPERDVAFRCRVRGSVALRDIVPPGIIDSMTGRHEIQKVAEADRQAAFEGKLTYCGFALLPEQILELNAFPCILCKRSCVSVWFEEGRVQRKFVQCMCERPSRKED